MITTNEKIKTVCEDISTLIEWAESDYEASIENDCLEQSKDDLLRIKILKEALERVSSSEKYSPKYWNKSATDYNTYQKLFDKLVPAQGEADTTEGEMLRIISSYHYDQYNNGHCNISSKMSDYETLLSLLNNSDIVLLGNSNHAIKNIANLITIVEALLEADTEVYDTETCTECDGDGEIDGETCYECGGSGEVEDIYAMSDYDDAESELNSTTDRYMRNDNDMEALDDLIHSIIQYLAPQTEKVSA